MRHRSKIDLTTGPTLRNLINFTTPILLQSSFQVIYTLTDRIWLGRLAESGVESVAAVTVVFPIIFFMISVVIGLSIGTGVLIAQYYGAGDRERVNLTARNYLAMGGIAVLIISVLMVVFAEQVLTILKTPENIFRDAWLYLVIQFAGLIFLFGFFGTNSIFRGIGDSITPTKVAAIIGVINLALDPVLIFGLGPFPQMGVAGAAYATVFSYVVGTVMILGKIKIHRDYVTLSPKGFHFDLNVVKMILRLALPSSGTIMMVSLSFMILMRFVNEHGTLAIAGYGVGVMVDNLLMMPAQSIGMAMDTITGQNIGAKKLDRVAKYLKDALLISFGLAAIGSILVVIFSSQITELFLREDVNHLEVIPYVRIYLAIQSVRYLTMAIFFPMNGVIRGAGDAMTAMIIVALSQLIIRIPIAAWLSHTIGFEGVPIAISLSSILGMVNAWIYYSSGKWIKRGGFVLDQVNAPSNK